MTYRELVFLVSEAEADAVGDALMDMGALSITVNDAAADTEDEKPLYGEPGLVPEKNAWEQSELIALFNEQGLSTEYITQSLQESGFEVQAPLERFVAEQDWVRLTQSQFDPIQVGQRLWVVPSWHESPPQADAVCLAVDPGLAFGTGSHPTTKLCMQWLESFADEGKLAGKTVLDYGCGSGILAIAAKKLGCGPALGVDIDEQAVISAKDNALRNEVAIDFYLPESDPIHERYDIVVANILANPLQVLAPALVQRILVGGYIVLSGILARQADEVINTYRPWLELSIWGEEDGWVCLTGQLTQAITQPQKKTAESLELGADASETAELATPNHSREGLIACPRWLATVMISFLGLVFFVQIVFLGRNAIYHQLAQLPENSQKTFLAGFAQIDNWICQVLPCQNIPLADFRAWAIEYAQLDMARGNGQLKLQIRNKLAVPIQWPHLEIVLTSADNQNLETIELQPVQWLPQGYPLLDAGRFAAPREEVASDLSLPVPREAAGYRIRVFYPENSRSKP